MNFPVCFVPMCSDLTKICSGDVAITLSWAPFSPVRCAHINRSRVKATFTPQKSQKRENQNNELTKSRTWQRASFFKFKIFRYFSKVFLETTMILTQRKLKKATICFVTISSLSIALHVLIFTLTTLASGCVSGIGNCRKTPFPLIGHGIWCGAGGFLCSAICILLAR